MEEQILQPPTQGQEHCEDDKNEKQKKRTNLLKELYGWLETFVLTILVLFLLVTFCGRYAPVKGGSMLPTLRQDDFVILSNLGYTPKQGDIVVVQSKDYGYDKPLVKRIIALGGQTVTLNYVDWTVIVDGVTLEEPYIFWRIGEQMNRGNQGIFQEERYTFQVPKNKLFVMGDNRNDSLDSRYDAVGFIDARLVMGKVVLRVFPFSSFGKIEAE